MQIRPPAERRYREEHAQLVVGWLQHHYEPADSRFTILKSTVLHDYLVFCRQNGIESTTAAVFGRFVKRAFPTIKCSRKGLDGRSLHCYRCLKRKSDLTPPSESSPRVPYTADDIAGTGSSGSDSADEGYDDELRSTIEELSLARGSSWDFADQPQVYSVGPIETQDDAAFLMQAPIKPEWQEPGALLLSSRWSISPLPLQNYDSNNQRTLETIEALGSPGFYPSQGREYFTPFPSDPQPYAHTPSEYATYRTSTTSSITTSASLAFPKQLNDYPYQPSESYYANPSYLAESVAYAPATEKLQERKPRFRTLQVEEPWTTLNPTPYPSAPTSHNNNHNPMQMPTMMTQASSTSASAYRPRLMTQACPVHTQPTALPPCYDPYNPHMRLA